MAELELRYYRTDKEFVHEKLHDVYDDLCQRMEPEKVCRALEWLGVFSREDREVVMREGPTTPERNSRVMDMVLERPQGERKLVEALRMAQPQLIAGAIPVTRHVLWLVASPSDAASVVREVESSERVEAVFGPVRTDAGCLFRSCLHFYRSNIVVTLAFPVADTDKNTLEMVRNAGEKWSHCSLVVFAGPCVSLEPLGHPWIVSEFGSCGGPIAMGNLQPLLGHVSDLERCNKAPWLKELTDQREKLVQFFSQMLWLVRLYIELSESDASAWLQSVGWNIGRSLDDNREVLLRFVPDWDDQDFQNYLLKESRQWKRDDSHPLRVQPIPSLKEAVFEHERVLLSSHQPHDIPATEVRIGKVARSGAISDDTVLSSRACQVADALDESLPGVPRLVCLSSLPPLEGMISEELRGFALQSCHQLCIECILHLTSDTK